MDTRLGRHVQPLRARKGCTYIHLGPGIDLGREPVPDETTVCRFRHLLEEHDLGRRLFDEVQRHLTTKGLKVATGTIVDATIINAPSSTKNADKACVFRGKSATDSGMKTATDSDLISAIPI